MRVVIVSPPDPVIELEEAKAHLRIDGDDDDALVTSLVAAATQHIDGPMGWLGRAIGVQTLEARGEFFLACDWALPCPPVVEVTSVEYLNPTGEALPLDTANYELRGSRVVRAFGRTWPAVRRDDENVRVRYQAGYETVPAPVRAAILLMVGDLYKFRETAAAGLSGAVPMSLTVENLLLPFRVWA